MITLTQSDRLAIALWLSALPEFESETGRRRLLSLTGIGDAALQIDVSGSPLLAAAAVVDFLVKLGRLTPEAEALGLLLNLVSSLVGIERQAAIHAMLRAYGMMTPMASAPAIEVPLPGWPAAARAEKIIGQNTLRPVSFLALGWQASRRVALMRVQSDAGAWTGTAFLVGPDLLATNHHVVGSSAEAGSSTVDFDFEDDGAGHIKQARSHRVTALVHTDVATDFTLLRVEGRPGDAYGWFKLRELPLKAGDRVNIIQHPGGQPKQVALQHNLVEYVGGGVTQYVTSTLPGSSGSPVLNDEWQVVAIHHAGGTIVEPTTGASFYRNEGVLTGSILTALPQAVAAELAVL
jgi:V8-like Glu-specific endopeptidase